MTVCVCVWIVESGFSLEAGDVDAPAALQERRDLGRVAVGFCVDAVVRLPAGDWGAGSKVLSSRPQRGPR